MTRVKHGSTSHRAQGRRTPTKPEPVMETQVTEPLRAYAVLNHGSKEVATVIAPNLADALWQARQLSVTKSVVAKDGGFWLLPTNRI